MRFPLSVRSKIVALAFALVALSALHFSAAENASEITNASLDTKKLLDDPEAWVRHIFSYFPEPYKAGVTYPDRPPANASIESNRAYLEKSTAAFNKVAAHLGIDLPQGTVALYDSGSGILIIETQAGALLDLMNYDTLRSRNPDYLDFKTETYEAPSSVIRGILEKTQDITDHTESHKELSSLVDKKEARLIANQFMQGRSAKTSVVQEKIGPQPIERFVIDPSNRVELFRELTPISRLVSIEAITHPFNDYLNASFKIEDHHHDPISRTHAVNVGNGSKAPISLPATDTHRTRYELGLNVYYDQSRIIASWSLPGDPSLARIVYFIPRCVNLYRPDSSEIAAMEALFDSVPAAPKPSSPSPANMQTRRYWASLEMLSITDETGDPFDKNSKTSARSYDTFKNYLEKDMGLTFPPGSYAHYDRKHYALEVRNTVENLDKASAVLDSVRVNPPAHISFVLEIIQTDQATLSKLMAGQEKESNHTQVWSKLRALNGHDKTKIVQTIRSDCRSGQRVLFETGQQIMEVLDLQFGQASDVSSTTAEKPIPGSAAYYTKDFMVGKVGYQNIGARLQLDPVLGPDGHTVDVELKLQHQPTPEDTSTEIECDVLMEDATARLFAQWTSKDQVNNNNLQYAAFIYIKQHRADWSVK